MKLAKCCPQNENFKIEFPPIYVMLKFSLLKLVKPTKSDISDVFMLFRWML